MSARKQPRRLVRSEVRAVKVPIACLQFMSLVKDIAYLNTTKKSRINEDDMLEESKKHLTMEWEGSQNQ